MPLICSWLLISNLGVSRIHAHSSNYYLRSWIFEGSIDGSTWTELNHHTNDQTTNSNVPIGTVSVSQHFKCQFVRLRQTCVNANGNHYLILFAVEFFGDLIRGYYLF
jgi:hypothetical protein